MSLLGAFNNQLIRFFEELHETYPEERPIKQGLDAIQAAKKINPRVILDLFYEHVARDLADAIVREDDAVVIAYAKKKISQQFNEMSVALVIFDKYWNTMTDANRKATWDYLKVLCALCEKVRQSRGAL